MLSFAAFGVLGLALAGAGLSDLVRYEIPNSLSLAIIAAFVPMALQLPLATSLWHVSAGLVVLALAAAIFTAGTIGGGDVKLLAATALWMGWHNLLPFILLTALAGALIALLLLILRRLAARLPTAERWYGRLLKPGEGVPYGLAIAASGLAFLPRLTVAELSQF